MYLSSFGAIAAPCYSLALGQPEFPGAALADADASAGTIYHSTSVGKLAYKDPSGTVHPLY